MLCGIESILHKVGLTHRYIPSANIMYTVLM